MIHYTNIEFILRHGMFAKSAAVTDPDFVSIGNTVLIEQRKTYGIKINPPGGNLGDYIPFYFGGHSPMLLNIITGYGAEKRDQSELIYVVCRIEKVINHCPEWCFTNGHAKDRITKFYNRLEDLSEVDWSTVGMDKWSSSEEDMDRQRKKQAEFLIKNRVPAEAIAGIIVKDEAKKVFTEEIISRLKLSLKVMVDTDNKYFYK